MSDQHVYEAFAWKDYIKPGLSTDRTSTAHERFPCDFVCSYCRKVMVGNGKLYHITNADGRDGLGVSIWVAVSYPTLALIPYEFNFGGEPIITDKKFKDWNPGKGGSFELYHVCEKRPEQMLLGYLYFDDVETPRSRKGLSEKEWGRIVKSTAWRPKLNVTVYIGKEERHILLPRGQDLKNHLNILVQEAGYLVVLDGPKQHVERHAFYNLWRECQELFAKYKEGAELDHLRNLLRNEAEGHFLQRIAGYALRKQDWEFSVLEKAYDEYFHEFLASNGSAMDFFQGARGHFVKRYLLAIQNSLLFETPVKTPDKKLALCHKVLRNMYPDSKEIPSDVAREMLNRYDNHPKRIEDVRKIFKRSKQDVRVLNKYHELELRANQGPKVTQKALQYFNKKLHPCTLRTRWFIAMTKKKPLDYPVFKSEEILKDLRHIIFEDSDQFYKDLRDLLSTLFASLFKPEDSSDSSIPELLSRYQVDLFHLAEKASGIFTGDTTFQISKELARHKLNPDGWNHREMEEFVSFFLDPNNEGISITSAASLIGYVASLEESWDVKKTKIARLWKKCKIAYRAPTSSTIEGYWKIDIAHLNEDYAYELKKKAGSLDAIAISEMYLELIARLSDTVYRKLYGTKNFEGLEVVVGKGNNNPYHVPGENSSTRKLVERFMPNICRPKVSNSGSLLVTCADLDAFFKRDIKTLWEDIFAMEN